MSSSFKPPIGKSLAKVDVAKDVQYGDHCVVVEGVVSPRVQGGHPGRDDSYDVHSFELAAWRLLGEPRWTVSSPYFDLSRPQSFREKNEMTTYLIDAQRIPFSS
jgi:hypothetical protein